MHRSIVTLRVGPTRSGLLAALLCGPLPLWGQGARPIRIIVPLTPGGSTDILARALAPKLAQALGRNVIGDNKPGAGGSLLAGHWPIAGRRAGSRRALGSRAPRHRAAERGRCRRCRRLAQVRGVGAPRKPDARRRRACGSARRAE
jgi:hypothetical protein